MSTNAPLRTHAASPKSLARSNQTGSLLQRKCADKPSSASAAGECAECKSKQAQAGEPAAREPAIGHAAARLQRLAAQRSTAAAVAGQDFSRVRVHAKPSERGGLPADLMAGLRHLSGADLPAVRVHYDSAEPTRMNALAYTHGADIHLAPGQERHLAHEGWHVVQQMQGRVEPTSQTNGVPLNDNEGLEQEADVMGAKAQAVGAGVAASHFRTGLADSTGAGFDDEPFVAAVAPVDRQFAVSLAPPAAGTGHAPVIQRVANFVAGTVTETTNLAAHVIAGNRDMGFTPPTLNGTAAMSAAAVQGAIKPPVLGGRTNADGTASTWVSTAPTNEASFTMKLPSAGPWSTVAKKSEVATLFASLNLTAQAACTGADNSTLRFNGKPSDATFSANVKTHENLHAADHKTGFGAVIVPWDTKIEAAKAAKTEFKGAAAAAAEATLFAAMGGTPAQVGTAQFDKWIALNNATHGGATLATGHTATASNSAANATCTTSSLDAT